MTSYHGLAAIYDLFMEDGPVSDWIEWIAEHPHWLAGNDVADLGCGTGLLLSQLPHLYHSAYGVDISADMLAVAASRVRRRSVQWLLQDLRELILPKPVHLALATCDVVNYLVTRDDVLRFLAAVRDHLQPGGVFLFDMLGPTRLASLEHASWFDLRHDAAVMVDATVGTEGRIRYDVTTLAEAENGLYRRTDESHQQQYYSVAAMSDLVREAGLMIEGVSGDFGRAEVTAADRVVYHTAVW